MRPPIEAAELHKALYEAETGKAQRQKGEALDIVLDGDLELQEGEILKLPPTPDQTDGTEHQSDPETERIVHASSLLAPPALPKRPGALKQHSSTSAYSNDEDLESVTEELPSRLVLDHGDLPPYEPGTVNDQFGTDIKGEAGPDTSQMSEAEKREWAEHLAAQAEESGPRNIQDEESESPASTAQINAPPPPIPPRRPVANEESLL